MGAFKTLFSPQWSQPQGDFWPQDMPPYSTLGTNTIKVNAENAYGVPAFFAAVRVISEDIAKLPWKVYRRLKPTGREIAEDHPLYELLHDAPNPEMTSFVWRETGLGHLLTWGNFFNEKVRNAKGDVKELWPLPPNRVQVKRRKNGVKYYEYLDKNGEPTILETDEVFHVPGLGFDGQVGYSVINMVRSSLAISLGAQEFARRFYENNARPGGTLTVPPNVAMTDAAADKLRDEFTTKHQGLSNAQRIGILRDGITFQEIGIPPEDAQFIQTRIFQVQEISRMMRISPHKIMELSRATFSNIEHLALEHVQDSLGGWAARLEGQVRKDLLRPDERGSIFTELNFDALLRGDALSRAQALWIQEQGGALTPNEWRDIENRNPYPEEIADKPRTPLNIGPLTDTAGIPLSPNGEKPNPTPQEATSQEATQLQ